MVIVDGRVLYVDGFNFTRSDVQSRSLGVITWQLRLVHEAPDLLDFGAWAAC